MKIYSLNLSFILAITAMLGTCKAQMPKQDQLTSPPKSEIAIATVQTPWPQEINQQLTQSLKQKCSQSKALMALVKESKHPTKQTEFCACLSQTHLETIQTVISNYGEVQKAVREGANSNTFINQQLSQSGKAKMALYSCAQSELEIEPEPGAGDGPSPDNRTSKDKLDMIPIERVLLPSG